MENSWKVYFKTVTGEETYTILQNQSLELVTTVIIINVVIDGFSGEGLMIGLHRLHPTVRLQLFRLIGHVRYINIRAWLRGFRVKIANFSIFLCPSIPKRDLDTKKATPNIKFYLKASEPC